jgi:hypothetical protein
VVTSPALSSRHGARGIVPPVPNGSLVFHTPPSFTTYTSRSDAPS